VNEIRSVQKTGGSTLTVSLPKDWAVRYGIDKGSRIAITENDDGSISIYPVEANRPTSGTSVIAIGHDIGMLPRRIIASYIMGFDTIILSSGRIETEQRSRIFEIIKDLMGLEVVREDSGSIELKQMLDPTGLPLPSAISRMSLLAESMIRDLTQALETGDEKLLSDLITRESHVDRLYWFIVREINCGIKDHRFAKSIDMDVGLATCYLAVARNIERICDHIENVARRQIEIPKRACQKSLVGLSKLCLDIFSRSVRAFIKRDERAAAEILTEVDRHREEYAVSTFSEISRSATKTVLAGFMLMAESLHRIVSYSQDIAEVTVDRVIVSKRSREARESSSGSR